MKALPSRAYGDPLAWCIEQESRTCKGCVWEIPLRRGDNAKTVCTKGKPHGKRCKQYQGGEAYGIR